MNQYSCFLIHPGSTVADFVIIDARDDQQVREAVAAILSMNPHYSSAEIYDGDMRLFELLSPHYLCDLPAAHSQRPHSIERRLTKQQDNQTRNAADKSQNQPERVTPPATMTARAIPFSGVLNHVLIVN